MTAPEVPLDWWEFYTISDDLPANPNGDRTRFARRVAPRRISPKALAALEEKPSPGCELAISAPAAQRVVIHRQAATVEAKVQHCSTARQADVARAAHVISSRTMEFPPAARHRPDSACRDRPFPAAPGSSPASMGRKHADSSCTTPGSSSSTDAPARSCRVTVRWTSEPMNNKLMDNIRYP